MGDGGAGVAGRDGVNPSHVLFDNFVQASTCKGTLKAFQELCDHLEVKPTESRVFYHKLKSKLNYWKAKALWAKLDKRASHKEYKKGRACANSKVSLHHWKLDESPKAALSGSAAASVPSESDPTETFDPRCSRIMECDTHVYQPDCRVTAS